MGLDMHMMWPKARRWLLDHYGDNAYLPQSTVFINDEQEPKSQKFAERWALITYTIEQPDGAHHTYFYLDFQDPNDEMVFILKWL